MDERIKEHLKLLNKYSLLLYQARDHSLDELRNDPIVQGSTERFLQLAIESCLNIGNRILALYQFQEPISPPETYADIFRQLGQLGVIDSEFVKRLARMAKFRNRLVHLYWELEPETIYDILQNHVHDFKAFEKQVVKFIQSSPPME